MKKFVCMSIAITLMVGTMITSARADRGNTWTSPELPKAPRPPAMPKPPAAPRVHGQGKSVLAWEALSSKYHAKEADAYQDALDVARSELVRRLSELKPGADFQPDLELVDGLVKSKEVLPETLEDATDKITVVKVKLKLEMNSGQRDELLRTVRMGDALQRQLGLGKGLLGLLAVLATAACYFRIEDRTKGYCTGWLKFGVIAVIALLGAAFFFVR